MSRRAARVPRAVDLASWLRPRIDALLGRAGCSSVVVALSGGVDSVALLAGLQRAHAGQPGGWALRAIHVNHHLHPDAARWESHCRSLCRRLGIPFTARHARIELVAGASVESLARDARYALLRAAARQGELVVTAQHLDDQLETVLLQLMRGAGVSGLAAMPDLARFGRTWLARPLLPLSRDEIAAWARQSRLEWADDDTNADQRFDRNYLRHAVLPLLRERWPAAARVAARSAAHMGEARELLAELGGTDLVCLQREGALDVDRLASLSLARQRNVLRAWLSGRGLPLPDTESLERVRVELREARRDASPVVTWAGAEVRRYRGMLYAGVPQQASSTPFETPDWAWQARRSLELGPGLGSIRLVRDAQGPIDGAALPERLAVRFRGGGERIRLRPGGPSRTLKELLRERGVLPWMRFQVPLLFAGEGLVAAAQLFTAAAFAAQPDSRVRYRLEWRGAPPVLAADPVADRLPSTRV